MTLRAAAALIALPPGASLSCGTAAELRGLPVTPSRSIHANLTAPGRRVRIEGITVHVREPKPVAVRGLFASAPAATFLELAVEIPLIDLVIVGDALVRHGWIRLAELHRAVDSAGSRRNIGRARRAVSLVRTGVDSPMETRTRLLAVLAGLPCPETGYRVIVDGLVIGWVDMAFPAYRVIIEYDGDLHRTAKKKWRSDVHTRDTLRELGWTVIVLTWDDYAVRPVATLERLCRELERRGCNELPTAWQCGHIDLQRLTAEWHAAFPGSATQAWYWADVPGR